jgi:hypothetical protein
MRRQEVKRGSHFDQGSVRFGSCAVSQDLLFADLCGVRVSLTHEDLLSVVGVLPEYSIPHWYATYDDVVGTSNILMSYVRSVGTGTREREARIQI